MTQITTFQPTFVQKLLGKNYKWWYFLKYKFNGRTTSVFDNSLFVVGQALILLTSILIWYLANNKVIDQGLQIKWTYFVIGELYLNLIFNFAEYEGFDFLRGGATSDLLKPQDFFTLKFFSTFGEAILQNLIKSIVLVVILVSLIFTNNISYFNLNHFLICLMLLLISAFLLYFFGITVAFSAFFLKQINGVVLNYGFVLNLLMGRLFPLDLLISNIWINLANPFSYIFYHPMQIYLGKYSPVETLLVFAGGLTWCVVLYFLAKFVFKMGLKRNESVGL